MKIGIIGNCAAPGIALALKQLRPEDTIYGIESVASQRRGNFAEVVDLIFSCDLVWTHRLHKGHGPLEWNEISSKLKRVTEIPTTIFTGFHPDSIYISGQNGVVGTPLGPYNSGIAAAVYSLGGTPEHAIDLFTPEVFDKLGYFSEFEKAKSFIQKEMLRLDVDIRPDWEKWMSQGPFMHTVNHPKAIVSATVAKAMAVNAGLISRAIPLPTIGYDTLAPFANWPIYPAFAEKFDVVGNYLFKKSGAIDHAAPTDLYINLKEFVAQSFASYGKYDRSLFDVPAVIRTATVIKDLL